MVDQVEAIKIQLYYRIEEGAKCWMCVDKKSRVTLSTWLKAVPDNYQRLPRIHVAAVPHQSTAQRRTKALRSARYLKHPMNGPLLPTRNENKVERRPLT